MADIEGSHSVRKNIPLKLKTVTQSKPRDSPQSDDSRSREVTPQPDELHANIIVDDMTLQHQSLEPIHQGQRLNWNYRVNLIGEKVKDPLIHCCEKCSLPILIYGRMIPCKHVFCFDCAKKTDKNCPRCGDTVQRIEQSALGTVFVCTAGGAKHGVSGCRRTYLSQRDLLAHVSHRHGNKGVNTPKGASQAQKPSSVANQRQTAAVFSKTGPGNQTGTQQMSYQGGPGPGISVPLSQGQRHQTSQQNQQGMGPGAQLGQMSLVHSQGPPGTRPQGPPGSHMMHQATRPPPPNTHHSAGPGPGPGPTPQQPGNYQGMHPMSANRQSNLVSIPIQAEQQRYGMQSQGLNAPQFMPRPGMQASPMVSQYGGQFQSTQNVSHPGNAPIMSNPRGPSPQMVSSHSNVQKQW